MSPVPPLVHLAAIAVGLWGVSTLMPGLAPDLPGEDAHIEAPAGTVSGPGDEDSYLRGSRLATALGDARAQIADDQEVISIRVEPATVDVDTGDSGGIALEDIVGSAPDLMVYAIGKAREGKDGRTDVKDASALRSAEFRADADQGVWTVHLDPSLPGPHAYTATIPTGTVAFQVQVRPVPGS